MTDGDKHMALKVEDNAVRFGDGTTLYDIHPNDDYWHRCTERCSAARPVEEAIAARVVACWNACAGIPTEVLKRATAHVMLNDNRLMVGASVEELPAFMRKCLAEWEPKSDLSCEARDY